jgi:hypothetical protein
MRTLPYFRNLTNVLAQLQAIQNARTTNLPELHGRVRPAEQQRAMQAAGQMKQAEQEYAETEHRDNELKQMMSASSDFTKAEVDARMDAQTRVEFEKKRAAYQAAKDQWKMSGDGMIAKSYVNGFDEYDDDTKTF